MVLRDRGEAGLDIAAAGHDDRGQPVGAPVTSRATVTAQHAVDALDEMRLVHGLLDHAAHPARMGQRAEQDERGATPGCPPPLEPVPLELGARGVGDLDGVPAPDPGAGLAAGTQPMAPDAPGERLVSRVPAERHQLVVERRDPQVRVVGEAGADVPDERFERVGDRAVADPGCPVTPQIRAHRPAVASDVPGDGRDRPSPGGECVDLHVVSLCEHGAGLLLLWLRHHQHRGPHPVPGGPASGPGGAAHLGTFSDQGWGVSGDHRQARWSMPSPAPIGGHHPHRRTT
jgi:hypothetical protein